MTAFSNLVGALRMQGTICGRMGSPFNQGLLSRIADDLEAGGPSCALLARWAATDQRTLYLEGTPIRVANTFNHLAMGGEAADLAAAWPRPGAAVDAEAAWARARAAIGPHFPALSTFLDHEPQTNEVRRTAGLLGGFLTVAAETGLPLRCFEAGASAGLNTLWDRFRYEAGPVAWGDPASPVRVEVDWQGGPPPLVPVQVIERGACDRRPSDLNDPVQRRRLLACIWPDMFHRLDLSRSAIDLALAERVRVDADDALDWTRAQVAPKAGAATVLYHSVFWQYLPRETQDGLEAAIQALGDHATEEAPFAWLRFEPPISNMTIIEVRLTLWPGGEERRLAEAHPHGAWVRWLA